MLEHASKILCELLFILVGIAAESITLLATPNELMCLAVEDIDDQSANFVTSVVVVAMPSSPNPRHLQPPPKPS
jgi:hypothetical protein